MAVLPLDVDAQLPGTLEGSNAGRKPDTVLSSSFTLHVPSHEAARRTAAELQLAIGSALGHSSPAEQAAARAAASLEREQRKRRVAIKRLTQLAADPVAVKQLRVPAGAVEGFQLAHKKGLIVFRPKDPAPREPRLVLTLRAPAHPSPSLPPP